MSDDKEKLFEEILLQELKVIREYVQDIPAIKADIIDLKADVNVLKTDVAVLKADVLVLKTDMKIVKSILADHGRQFKRTTARVSKLEAKV
ncbi:MAG TPA: hypothetical protein VIJ68_04575 [Candidatus Saccharimonadales bacterium]